MVKNGRVWIGEYVPERFTQARDSSIVDDSCTKFGGVLRNLLFSAQLYTIRRYSFLVRIMISRKLISNRVEGAHEINC